MSRENHELVRRASALVSASCQAGVPSETLLAMCTADIRVDASRRVFNPDVYDGTDGMRRMVREIHEAWEGFEERIEQLLDTGEKVVSLHVISGRGRGSGVEVESEGALVWTLQDGHVRLVEVFADRDEALALAGVNGSAAVVRRFLEHVNTGDIDAALTFVAPGAVLDWSDSQAPDRGLYEGPEGWGSWLAGRGESLAEARFDVEEVTEVRPGTVVLVAHMRGRGRASGLEIGAQGASVCIVSDGRLTGLTLYHTREGALGSLGLS